LLLLCLQAVTAGSGLADAVDEFAPLDVEEVDSDEDLFRDIGDPGSGDVQGPPLDDDIDLITVRGQRTGVDTQDQAIAISSFGQEDLDQLGVSDMQTLQKNIPSLHIGQAGTRGVITLRGVGVSNLGLTGEQSVLIVLDGVPLGRPTAALQAFYDVASVQALRGPQGTQGGRHVTGGLLEVNSMPPLPDFSAAGDYQYGSYDQHIWRGYLNIPIYDEKLMMRLTTRFEDRDGYQMPLGGRFRGNFPATLGVFTENDAWGNAHDLISRVQFRSVLTDKIDIRLIGQYAFQKGNGPAQHLLGVPNPQTGSGCQVNLNCVPNETPRYPTVSGNPRRTYRDYAGHQDNSQIFLTGKLAWDINSELLGPLQLNAQFGFNRSKQDVGFDSDNTNASATNVISKSAADQYSGQVSLRTVESRPWQWMIGALWWHETVETDAIVDIGGASTEGDGGVLNNLTTDTLSGFGEFGYWLNDEAMFGFGLNYSTDLKQVISRRVGFEAFGRSFGIPIRNEGTWSKLTWKVLFDWQWSDNNKVTLNVTTGFKAGGFPLGVGCESLVDCPPFGEEAVTQYEITSKNQFFDERLLLNLTLFWTDYDPYQICLSVGVSQRCAQNGIATVRGAELEFTAYPIPELQISGNFNILDARVDNHRVVDDLENRFFPGSGPPAIENLLSGFPQDLSGNTLERSPRYNLSVRVRYELRTEVLGLPGGGAIAPQLQYQYQSRTYFRIFNIKEYSQPAQSIVNMRVTWRSEDDRWTIAAFLNNVADTDAINFMSVGAGPEVLASYNLPRWAGIQLGYRF
jgi:iron complex outermembrane receptor protein